MPLSFTCCFLPLENLSSFLSTFDPFSQTHGFWHSRHDQTLQPSILSWLFAHTSTCGCVSIFPIFLWPWSSRRKRLYSHPPVLFRTNFPPGHSPSLGMGKHMWREGSGMGKNAGARNEDEWIRGSRNSG